MDRINLIFNFIKNSVVDDWKMVAFFSYSALATFVVLFCVHAPDIIYLLFEVDTNPKVWTGLLSFWAVLIYVGRLVRQPKRNAWRRRAVIAAIIAVSVVLSVPAMASTPPHDGFHAKLDQTSFDLISKWEGKRNASYQDIVGVWTICYGHTRTAAPGQYKTDAECADLLRAEIIEYRAGLHRYFTEDTLRRRLTFARDAAYTSLAFNVGIRGAGRSTATRRLNRGDIAGGCEALTWWNKAGGRVVRGLVRRRSDERRYCRIGLPA